MQVLKRFVDNVIVPPCRNVKPLRQLVIYVSRSLRYRLGDYSYFNNNYNYLKSKFIENGKQSRWSEITRAEILEQFELIDERVEITTTPTDGLFLVEALLSLDLDGTIIECGCYTGGSTAKLSIIAKMMNKELLVFDSFGGLPEPDQYNKIDYHTRRISKRFTGWIEGKYAASLEQVKSNIQKYGEISVCSFYQGWFSDTLKQENLPQTICCAFVDVDLASSARECLVAIWPRIRLIRTFGDSGEPKQNCYK
jgi:O-methyltransferase